MSPTVVHQCKVGYCGESCGNESAVELRETYQDGDTEDLMILREQELPPSRLAPTYSPLGLQTSASCWVPWSVVVFVSDIYDGQVIEY